MPTLGKTIFELSRIFRLLNEAYYSSELPAPIIAVQMQGKSNAYGWCTTRKIWSDTNGGQGYYEITLTAEYLTRSNEQIVATMLHEMATLYCGQAGIKDTSRSGIYHNERFKSTAEAHGLCIGYDKKIGWSLTTLSEDAKALLPALKINRQAFRVSRQLQPAKGKNTSKQSSRKYICPNCGVTVRATKAVNIICADCLQLMLPEVKENE